LLHSEPHLLALYALIVAITMVVQVGAAALTVGLPYLSSARDAQKPLGTVPERLRRTVDNSVVALALVAPAVLLVETGGVGIPQTVLAMQVFVLARRNVSTTLRQQLLDFKLDFLRLSLVG
jgi:uncharacterized MAPEG superfamily protein